MILNEIIDLILPTAPSSVQVGHCHLFTSRLSLGPPAGRGRQRGGGRVRCHAALPQPAALLPVQASTGADGHQVGVLCQAGSRGECLRTSSGSGRPGNLLYPPDPSLFTGRLLVISNAMACPNLHNKLLRFVLICLCEC